MWQGSSSSLLYSPSFSELQAQLSKEDYNSQSESEEFEYEEEEQEEDNVKLSEDTLAPAFSNNLYIDMVRPRYGH